MTDAPAKRLFIKTYGCQMNVYDSGRMADVLAPLGYVPAESAADADMVILNTCHIAKKRPRKCSQTSAACACSSPSGPKAART